MSDGHVSIKSTWQDYFTLCKPKVVWLMLLTAWVGMLLAAHPTYFPFNAFVWGSLGIGMASSSAAVINHLVERHIDIHMHRTQHRPVAAGKIEPTHALLFALTLGVTGLSLLILFVNSLTAWLTLITLIGYAIIYTIYLKKATPQNIVIGGLAGAAPPLLGWTSVTGTIDHHSLLLVLIIFTWTPPHFWALAIHRKHDYQRASLPMLPVTHGVPYTKLNILLYTFLMIATTLLPFVTRMSGGIYLIIASLLNIGFLYYAFRLYFDSTNTYAIKLFGFSIIYLMCLFIALILDHYGCWYLINKVT